MNTGRPVPTPITSPRSERVRRIAALAGRSARRKQGRFRAEGPQAVRSLLEHRPDQVVDLFLTADATAAHPELAGLAERAGLPVHEIDPALVRAMTRAEDGAEEDASGGAVSPQGVLAVGRLPVEDPDAALAAVRDLPAEAPLTVVVLHEVRDPGNVGTLLRTADAAGADLVVLTRTSADPYSPKAVRAAVGSTFHLPVLTGAAASELLGALADQDVRSLATSGHAETDLFDAPLPQRLAWWLGNEARGLDPEVLAAADLAVRIPLAGHAESLNVHTAATVCLFETLRRRRAAGASR